MLGRAKFVSLSFSIMLLLILNFAVISSSPNLGTLSYVFAQEENRQVVLNAIFDNLGQIEKKERWQLLFGNALEELNTRHPGLDIKIRFTEFPGNESRIRILSALENKPSVDIISVD